jgi:hypothetical protein
VWISHAEIADVLGCREGKIPEGWIRSSEVRL